MADIFISYKLEDQETASALSEALEGQGWTTWWDSRLAAGESFDSVIEEQLAAARCVVVLWSQGSIKSRWVKAEAGDGLERNILVPVLIEDVRPPLIFRNIHAANMVGWKMTALEACFDRLVDDLERVLGPPPIESDAPTLASPTTIDYGSTVQLAPSYTNSIGMELMLIPPGTFMMGADDAEDDERPVHRVQITEPFYLSKYAVTQAQWETVMEDNPSTFSYGGDYPVETVSWNDVQAFIARMNAVEVRYRLPTEAEWEYACRAGTFGPYAGNVDLMAWHKGNSGGAPHPCGRKQPNAWGLYDMHGNVWEWVNDWYADDYYANSPGVDPWGPDQGVARVLRGGGWQGSERVSRASNRFSFGPDFREAYLGFRVARRVD